MIYVKTKGKKIVARSILNMCQKLTDMGWNKQRMYFLYDFYDDSKSDTIKYDPKKDVWFKFEFISVDVPSRWMIIPRTKKLKPRC